MPPDSNADRNVGDRYAGASAKGNTYGLDGEDSTAVAKDDAVAKDNANGKTVPSKSGGSTGRGGCKCKGKSSGRQTERPLKVKSRGRRGKGRGKGKGKGRGKTGDTSPDVDDTTPKGIMKILTGSICLKLGLSLLAGLGVQFSGRSNAKYGLPECTACWWLCAAAAKKAPPSRVSMRRAKIRARCGCPADHGF